MPLFTRVDFFHIDTGAARYLAAPLEATLTVPLDLDLLPSLSTLTAHQITPVDPVGSDVALAAMRPKGTRFRTGFAEIIRILGVHQIPFRRELNRRIIGHEAVTVVSRYHLGRTVKVLLETCSDLGERGHLHPAGSHGAGSGQPVALALHSHELLYGLGGREKIGFQVSIK